MFYNPTNRQAEYISYHFGALYRQLIKHEHRQMVNA